MYSSNLPGKETPGRLGMEWMVPDKDLKEIISNDIDTVLSNLGRPVTQNENPKDVF